MGLGLVITSIFFFLQPPPELSEVEIEEQARELGMVYRDEVVFFRGEQLEEDLQNQDLLAEDSLEQDSVEEEQPGEDTSSEINADEVPEEESADLQDQESLSGGNDQDQTETEAEAEEEPQEEPEEEPSEEAEEEVRDEDEDEDEEDDEDEDAEELIQVTIPSGYYLTKIATLLEEKGVLKDKEELILMTREMGVSHKLRRGRYQLPREGDPLEVLKILMEGGETID